MAGRLPEPSADMLETAADWADRAGALTLEEEKAYAAWLAESREHRWAADQVRRVLLDPALLEALGDVQAARPEAAPALRFGPWLKRFVAPLPAAGLAAMVLVLGGVIVLMTRPSARVEIGTLPPVLASARPGETQTVVLPDGSTVRLFGRSALTFTMSASARTADLGAGLAHFSVSSDAGRPFTVRAGGAEVTAIGTAFSVDRLSSGVEVRVYEGRVAARAPDAETVELDAGEWVAAQHDGLSEKRRFTAGDEQSWLEGWVEAEAMPLAELVERLNRYTSQPVRLSPAVDDRREVTGRFKLSDVETTLLQIESILDLQAQDLGDRTVLMPR